MQSKNKVTGYRLKIIDKTNQLDPITYNLNPTNSEGVL